MKILVLNGSPRPKRNTAAMVGAVVEGKPNWLLIGHLGIMGHDHIMMSLANAH